MNETNQPSESLIAVTGGSGHLGRLVVEALLAQNLPANRIVALVRDPQKVADFASRGVQVRRADYTQPETLEAAFEGVERLLLVSSNEVGQRLPQHKNAIEAAKRGKSIGNKSVFGEFERQTDETLGRIYNSRIA